MQTLFAQIEASSQIENLDDAVRPIQDILGQDDGGPASMFFSDSDEDAWQAYLPSERKFKLIRYVVYEMGVLEFSL